MGLTFTDRSRYVSGISDCMMARFLGYHFMDTGLISSGFSIPLATGSAIHLALEIILKKAQVGPSQVNDLFVRIAVDQAIESFTNDLDSSFIGDFGDPAALEYIVKEQGALITGLAWSWYLHYYPDIIKNYDIVSVEEEYETVLKCTCGIGKLGKVEDHAAKDCNGVVLMTRPDVILRNKVTGTLVYLEFKSGASVIYDSYDKRFFDNVQFALGTAAASDALDEPIEQLMVHALHKGRRKKDPEEFGLRQDSPFCYAFVRPENPPVQKMDISPKYYKVVNGRNWGCTPNRGYTKRAIWEIEFDDKPEDMSNAEYYTRFIIDDETRLENLKTIHPEVNMFLVDRLKEEIANEEFRWQDRLELIKETVEANEGDWYSQEVKDLLLILLPRSWNCKKYGDDYPCSYIPYCHEKEQGKDLLDNGFIPRTPNHPIEEMNGLFEV